MKDKSYSIDRRWNPILFARNLTTLIPRYQEVTKLLDESSDRVSIPELREKLLDEHPFIQSFALMKLSEIEDEEARVVVQEALESPNPILRFLVSFSNMYVQTKDINNLLPTLQQNLKDSDADVRLIIALSLASAAAEGELGETAIPILLDALQDEDAVVRLYAVRGLEKIGTVGIIPTLWRFQLNASEISIVFAISAIQERYKFYSNEINQSPPIDEGNRTMSKKSGRNIYIDGIYIEHIHGDYHEHK